MPVLAVAIRRIPYLASQAEDETCKGGELGSEGKTAGDGHSWMFTAWRGREKNKAEETRGDPPPSQHTRNRGLFSLFFRGRARMWSKNRDFGWKRQKRRFGPDGCRRGEEGGLSIHLCPGVQKDVGPISGHAYLPPFPKMLRVRLAEAFTRRKGRKTQSEFLPSPSPSYFFRPICHPTHLGGIERGKARGGKTV